MATDQLSIFSIHELGGRTGAVKNYSRAIPAPEGFGLALIGIKEGSTITTNVQLEAVGEGVWVTGSAEFELIGQCARCLTEIKDDGAVSFQELFLFPGKEPQEEDVSRIDGEDIDILPLLHDQIVLELPFTPLCRLDCVGLCPECGANLNENTDHSHEATMDPRWRALSGFDPKNATG